MGGGRIEKIVLCVVDFHTSLLALCACQLRRDESPCIVCRRQPPSLRDLCSNAYFLNLRDFKLNSHTTFQQYVYAVNSGLVMIRKLLPPDFPLIQLSFVSDTFDTKTHPNCPGGRSWNGTLQREFDIPADAILALSDENKKKHSGAAHVIGASSSATLARYIQTSHCFHPRL